jgi:hypothetical protein
MATQSCEANPMPRALHSSESGEDMRPVHDGSEVETLDDERKMLAVQSYVLCWISHMKEDGGGYTEVPPLQILYFPG